MKKWMINHGGYLKACCKAVSAMQPFLGYTMKCDSTPDENYNQVTLAVDPSVKGVSIKVSPPDGECQSIEIQGKDEAHLFYAVCDFKNLYIPYVKTGALQFRRWLAPRIFDEPLPEYDYESAPKINERGIWTWGHTIYDYRSFIDNMAELKMNTLIIWNDFVPTNIDEVIHYAHDNYIKVYLGYAWGWDTVMPEEINDAYIDGIVKNSLKTHREQYKNVKCDGIYFQTITEHCNENLSGRSVAKVVVDMVNRIGEKILSEQPDLKILFGLHAMPVSNNLDDIAKVDERISIIWEDVGAFPWHYFPDTMDTFDETVDFTRKIRDLREMGGFGGVLKGYVNLFWGSFKHHEGPCPIGVSTDRHIKDVMHDRREFDRYFLAVWLKYAPKAIELIKEFKPDSLMTVLVEDACFEEKVSFPVGLYAALLWDADRDAADLFYETALNPIITF